MDAQEDGAKDEGEQVEKEIVPEAIVKAAEYAS